MNARQRAEFEAMLIGEALRRLKLNPARDMRRWALHGQMTRGERAFIAVITAPYRIRDWVARRIRA